MLGKIILWWDGLNCAAVEPSRCAQNYRAMEGRLRRGTQWSSTAFTSPGSLWKHSGVQLSVHLSTHPSPILLSPHSPVKALPSHAGGECRARASCSSTKPAQRRRRTHRKAQPGLTSPRAFPATSGRQQPTFCSPDQGTLSGHDWKPCMEPMCSHCVPETTATAPSGFGRQRGCAAPRKLFLCPHRRNLVLSEREESPDPYSSGGLWSVSNKSFLAGICEQHPGRENFIRAEKSFQPAFGMTPASLKYP